MAKKEVQDPEQRRPDAVGDRPSTSRMIAKGAIKLAWVVPVVIAAMEMLPTHAVPFRAIKNAINRAPEQLVPRLVEFDAELADDALV